jgi:S-methylmethionine-dependent homocysteine/selenocysteine methylase
LVSFLKSGADIIETGSYQINQDNLMKYLKVNADEADCLIRRSVEIAVEAREELKSSKNLDFLIG